ncbi:MAG: SusE domain-containing protein [Chitinophagaceae bacterium]|jgi:starch-binding outer membrane protein SusE/F|nr:SusE domain-containing protein [Chitinophagaceae bacterium]
MKLFNQLCLSMLLLVFAFTACEKAPDLPVYGNGVASVLSAASTTVAPSPADSNKYSLVLNWTDPKHAQSPGMYKFVIEIDSSGRNFSKAYTRTVIGKLTDSIVAKEFNAIMLAWGFEFNKAYDVDVRVTSSYGNNNEKIVSNILRIRATPYKIPPKVALPTTLRLFVVGDGTEHGWSDAIPNNPIREFTRIDETTWGAIFNYSASGSYKIWETWGGWGSSFRFLSGTAFAGTFEKRDADPGWSSPGVGAHKMIMDFQKGTYSVTKVDNAVPTQLWITGDATTTNWTNDPRSNPAQKFTHLSSGLFEITITLAPGKLYKFLSSPGNWQPQFGGSSATGGTLGANYGGGGDPDAVPTPATAGSYKITVNFITGTYTVVKL